MKYTQQYFKKNTSKLPCKCMIKDLVSPNNINLPTAPFRYHASNNCKYIFLCIVGILSRLLVNKIHS